jgi:type II secretion system protein N
MKLKSILLYILFFSASSLVFVFLLFPRAEFANYLSYALKRQNLVVTIDNVKPAIPFTLKFENTKFLLGQNINQNTNQGIHIVPQSFEVLLDPVSIFKDKKQIKFQSGFYQGFINGHLFLNSFDPLAFSNVTASMSGVKISGFAYKTDLADITLGCELNGEYKQTRAGDKKDFGNGRMLISNFSAQMKDSLFNNLHLPVVDFSEITLEFIQHPKRITLTQCTAKGSIINVKLKGSMDIIFPVQKTRLNLTGVIQPDSPYLAKFVNMAVIKSVVKNIKKNGIIFTIKGTLENPEIGI